MPSRLPSAVWVIALLLLAAVASAPASPRGRRLPRWRAAVPGPAGRVVPGPQCRPGRAKLSYHGGDLVTQPSVFVIFWGSEWQSDPRHVAAASALRTMFQRIGTSGYECAWREYALPGKPIADATYAGDEVVATAPVKPGHELSDAAIQDRIGQEIAAGRTPSASDGIIFVVAPPSGVAVNAGGETGCGGSNFVFCAYHDSFRSGPGGSRIRYAVLPFPCNQGGFTCFADAQDDAGRALESNGSHEVAEIVTDPDQPPVAAGGWFDDRSGSENADVCESFACQVSLPLGDQDALVNSLWSNLGADCVADAPCAAPSVVSCNDAAPGSCVAAPHTADPCAFEWLVFPDLALSSTGLPGSTVRCADGQPFCDFDGSADGQCTFHLAACLNSSDPRFACAPSAIGAITVTPRLVDSGNPVDRADAAALLAALGTVDPASAGTVSGGTVSFSPPSATADACTGFVDVAVPLRGTTQSGNRTVRLTVRTASGVLTESVKLVCNPAFP